MSTTLEVCACHACLCNVEPEKAVKKEGQYYCSQQCAQGHVDHQGCGHTGCDCS